ncbi:universal stress protein [Phocicoccus pinnipedialis]|uniref:Universal stress protein n=1 Tax=Phocicoccus pinnipedialis TaxID=110845 RepID=A0A6V7RDE4_9BACL|nr:universal stress protein [Jeotgalicoccus pinnipedialis]MBP1939507.1 nucleotide-binding universal stress UspA family protein [Jeotgalicoccus pinnipedialis]CAD2075098.1 Putative universal stress protein [Jeotgalicoccus pinnipedialis]
MLNYKNILIAVDGSHEAEWAFQKAVDIAKRNDARLIVTNVIDTRSYASVEAYDRTISERAKTFAEKLLEGYVQHATEQGISDVVKVVEYGSPKAVIPKKIVKDTQADLVVVGSTGLNAVERFIIGSVSEAIVRHSPCDVLVVRTETLPADFKPVVATDELVKGEQ